MSNVPASISRVCFHIDGVDFPPVTLRDCGHYASISFGAFPAELVIFVSWLSAKAIIEALTPFVDKPIVAPPEPELVSEEIPL